MFDACVRNIFNKLDTEQRQFSKLFHPNHHMGVPPYVNALKNDVMSLREEKKTTKTICSPLEMG